MAINKIPKNYYSDTNIRRDKINEIIDEVNDIASIPSPSAEDAGKIIKVGEDGSYELGEDAGSDLPDVTLEDNGSLLQVRSGAWSKIPQSRNRILTIDSNNNIFGSITTSAIITKRGSTWTYSLYGVSVNRDAFNVYVVYGGITHIMIDDDGLVTSGTIISKSPTTIVGTNVNGIVKIILIVGTSLTYTPIGSIKYYEIESSGSSVSLPSGVTFADVYAELQNGVDVKFTSGARVYSVTSFESTNIRAYWMSDLDLTSMEVYVINLASDGTGTVASATFSGS